MQDSRAARAALRDARSKREVASIIERFLASFSPDEASAMPSGFSRGGRLDIPLDEIAAAALDLKREELLHAFESPQMRTLEAATDVLAAASARLAEISAPAGHLLRSMTTPMRRGTAERRIARRPDGL
jgi:hypothetical protein